MFDWDDGNIRNIGRHSVAPSEAEEALLHGACLVISTRIVRGEARLAILGETRASRILQIVITLRQNAFRVVTARDAGRQERCIYQGSLR